MPILNGVHHLLTGRVPAERQGTEKQFRSSRPSVIIGKRGTVDGSDDETRAEDHQRSNAEGFPPCSCRRLRPHCAFERGDQLGNIVAVNRQPVGARHADAAGRGPQANVESVAVIERQTSSSVAERNAA